MALNSLGLGFVFTAKDLASGTMRKVEGRFRSLDTTSKASAASFKKNVGMMIGGLAIAAGGAVALGGAFKLAGKFGTFEQGLAKVGAITRATSADMEQLEKRAIKAGIETQFSPDEAVEGLTALGIRGFTTQESMKALGGALDLAAGGQIGVEQAASATASALRVFSMQAEDAGLAADKLLKISNLTAIESKDLELMLGTVARGASQTKQSLDEMAVSMGLVKNTGVDASVAASSVSSALQFVAKNQNQFKKLGVEVTNADGSFRDFLDIVQDADAELKTKFPNAADRTAKGLKLFGRFGVAAFSAVSTQLENGIKNSKGQLLTGAAAVKYLREEMADAAGTAAKFREQLLDTFEGQKTLLKGSMQTLAITTGEAFAKVFKPLTSIVIKVINGIIDVVQAIPGPIKTALGSVFVLMAALVTIAGIVMASVAAFGLLKMAVIAFSGPLIAAATGLALITVAAGALVGAFKAVRYAFDENIGGFGDSIKNTLGKVKLFFDAISQLTSGDGKIRGDALKKLFDPANKSILTMVQRFAQARHRVKMFFTGFKEGVNGVLQASAPTFEALGEAVKELFAALGFGAKGMELMTSKGEDFRSKGEVIGRIIGEIAKFLVGGLTVAIRVVTGALAGFKVFWDVLLWAMTPVIAIGKGLIWVFGQILSLFGLVFEAGNKTGGAFDYIAKAVGFAVGVFVAFKTLMIASRLVMLAYRGAMLIAAAAQAIFSGGAIAAAAAFLGPAALVAGIGAAAYAIGSFIDEALGMSDALAGLMADITGVNDELKGLDEAYSKTVESRGGIGFLSLEQGAEQAGMSVDAFADKRAGELAQDQQAKDLGLDKTELKRRLIAGEKVYKELAGPAKPPSDAADGVVASADGEANKAKAAARQQEDAFAAALERAEKSGTPIQITNVTKFGDEEIARNVQKGIAAAGSLDFQANGMPLGEF